MEAFFITYYFLGAVGSIQKSTVVRAIRCNLFFVPQKSIFASIPQPLGGKSFFNNTTRFIFFCKYFNEESKNILQTFILQFFQCNKPFIIIYFSKIKTCHRSIFKTKIVNTIFMIELKFYFDILNITLWFGHFKRMNMIGFYGNK